MTAASIAASIPPTTVALLPTKLVIAFLRHFLVSRR